nr:histidine kinase [uncultured Rhodoferax sp.]
MTSLNDDLRRGVQGSYWLIFRSWASASIALAVLSLIVYLCLSRWPRWVSSAKMIASGYGVLLLILMPLQLIFLAKLYLQEDGPGWSWAQIEQQVQAIDELASLLRLSSITAVYLAVVAVKIWQQSQLRAQAWAQEQANALAVRLELEQQRGLALRAQLEPHFVFNALSAIVALVRSDRKDVALNGIQGLSELLRYALSASERHWVLVRDELQFINEYLSLQRLRYGKRLQLSIEGASESLLNCDCPPLLLQPLVENALRHDLDCHADPSDIRLVFEHREGRVCVCISNPVHKEAAHNPGVGLGLRNIAARLQLAYGATASIQSGRVGDRFQVMIEIPEHAPE